MKKIWILFVIIAAPAFGQLEMSKWYFGKKAALDFSMGCPMPISESALNTNESCSSISNAQGVLQFYTNGIQVYNRNNEMMTNGDGLLGELSSTHGALIVPFPNNSNKYYIFTADAFQNYSDGDPPMNGLGINYSVVNMAASGGLGTVEEKNVNLLPQGSEKLTAVQHSNGTDYWMVTNFENKFYAYRLRNGQIDKREISSAGYDADDFNNLRGAMKISPDGTKLAICHTIFEPEFNGIVELFDFNATTGEVTNRINLAHDNLLQYGVEFSPNSEVLYTSGSEIIGSSDTGDIIINQYDLKASDISSSKYTVARNPSNTLGGDLSGLIQVAIDTKLYHTFGGAEISVIRRPNRLGVNCDYLYNAVGLGLANASKGLPVGVQSYYDNIIEYDELCSGDATQFFLNTSRGISNVSWNFGDPGSGVENTSSLLNPTHFFSGVGSFTIRANVTFTDGSTSQYEVIIKITNVAGIPVDPEITQCDLDDDVLDGRTLFNLPKAIIDILIIPEDEELIIQNVTFHEDLVDASNELNPIENPNGYEGENGQVIYANLYYSLDCFRTIAITLNVEIGENAQEFEFTICASSFGEESAVILVDSVKDAIAMTYPDTNIRIYSTITNAILETNEKESSVIFDFDEEKFLYYRLGEEGECIGVGRILIELAPPIEGIEDQTQPLCNTVSSITLEGPSGFLFYDWDTGATTQNIEVDKTGVYSLRVTIEPGCSALIQYSVTEGPVLGVTVTVNDFNQNNEILINTVLTDGTPLFSIDGGVTFQESGTFSDLSPGTYDVVVIDSLGCNRITETVVVRGAPRYFTPNNDGFHDTWHVFDVEDYPGIEIEIFDRFGKRIASLTDQTPGWDGTYNGQRAATSTYWYSVTFEGNVSYGHVALVGRGL